MAVKLVAIMLRKHDKLDYRRLLDRCCPRKAPSRRCMTEAQREEIVANMVETDNVTMLSAPPELGESLQTQQQHSMVSTQTPKLTGTEKRPAPRFTVYRTPTKSVARFAKLVLLNLVPFELFGSMHNRRQILSVINAFVSARRFETLNLHHIAQGIRITDCHWLLPANRRALKQRPTAEEMEKRRCVLNELIYYLFDSILIPLLRTSFYATESAAFRNRTLFFRQDDWLNVSAPVLDKLKATAFEPVSKAEALSIMSARNFGYSYIRLLPKETGVRPIVNLRRRSQKYGADPYKMGFQQSINSVLESTFHILNYEKAAQPDLLGASVFGANDIYVRLKRFKQSFQGSLPKLYFVKVDIKCAFDTIDQTILLDIIKDLLSNDSYIVQRYTRLTPAGSDRVTKDRVKRACPETDQQPFDDLARELAKALRHVIFSDGVVYPRESRVRLIALLEQHVRGNLVRIGKDFCRQNIGIPQGSSLSTLLCSYYFAKMEREKLSHLKLLSGDESSTIPGTKTLLLRYTDDFLLITASKSTAVAFFDAMNQGFKEYGCSISPAKSLCNFDLPIRDTSTLSFSGGYVPRLSVQVDDQQEEAFPWCGFLVRTGSLAVMHDLDRYRGIHIADTLTIEYGSSYSSSRGVRRATRPGQAMQAKLLASIKSRCHVIFADSTLHDVSSAEESGETVRLNIYQACIIAALKLISYWHGLSRMKGGCERGAGQRRESSAATTRAEGARLLLSLVKRACRYMHECLLMRTNSARLHLDPGAKLSRSVEQGKKDEVVWLGMHAFETVIRIKTVSRHSRQLQKAGGGRALVWDLVRAALSGEMQALVPSGVTRTGLEKTAQRAWFISKDVVHSIHV